jgi:hypothetical protein
VGHVVFCSVHFTFMWHDKALLVKLRPSIEAYVNKYLIREGGLETVG